MQRERYAVVRDERDAYQQLQDQFSSQLDTAFQMVDSSTQEKERLQIEVRQAKKDIDDAKFFIKKIGTVVGVSIMSCFADFFK
jgi:hypothetical protein